MSQPMSQPTTRVLPYLPDMSESSMAGSFRPDLGNSYYPNRSSDRLQYQYTYSEAGRGNDHYCTTPNISSDNGMADIEAAKLLLHFTGDSDEKTNNARATDYSFQNLSIQSPERVTSYHENCVKPIQTSSYLENPVTSEPVPMTGLSRIVTPPHNCTDRYRKDDDRYIQGTTQYLHGVRNYMKTSGRHLSYTVKKGKGLDYENFSNMDSQSCAPQYHSRESVEENKYRRDSSSGCFDQWAPYARERPHKPHRQQRSMKNYLAENHRRLISMYAQQGSRVRKIIKSRKMEEIQRSLVLDELQEEFLPPPPSRKRSIDSVPSYVGSSNYVEEREIDQIDPRRSSGRLLSHHDNGSIRDSNNLLKNDDAIQRPKKRVRFDPNFL
mmetsp:Transcript_27364/g.54751  ORF Transcript_27364/g.54751 Transcript_27364/m.54751 type:complete len:381 (+) Transcript_27364:145-1287(+)